MFEKLPSRDGGSFPVGWLEVEIVSAWVTLPLPGCCWGRPILKRLPRTICRRGLSKDPPSDGMSMEGKGIPGPPSDRSCSVLHMLRSGMPNLDISLDPGGSIGPGPGPGPIICWDR